MMLCWGGAIACDNTHSISVQFIEGQTASDGVVIALADLDDGLGVTGSTIACEIGLDLILVNDIPATGVLSAPANGGWELDIVFGTGTPVGCAPEYVSVGCRYTTDEGVLETIINRTEFTIGDAPTRPETCPAYCGNGYYEPWAGESCDDGPLNGTCDHCAYDCSGPHNECGDGQQLCGEECDDGNADLSDDCPNCFVARCGDGFTRTGGEQCDDGGICSDDAAQTCFAGWFLRNCADPATASCLPQSSDGCTATCVDEDKDEDGFAPISLGGTDCDDETWDDPEGCPTSQADCTEDAQTTCAICINPDALEMYNDGIDSDCDGNDTNNQEVTLTLTYQWQDIPNDANEPNGLQADDSLWSYNPLPYNADSTPTLHFGVESAIHNKEV